MKFDCIPQALKDKQRWLVARMEIRDGRQTKVPYVAADPSRKASSTDPATWSDFDTARRVADAEGLMLGFSLEGSGDVGVDIDHCRDPKTRVVESWATAIIEELDTYAEASVSGTGVHLIFRGSLPAGRRRTGKGGQFAPVPEGAEIEMYDSGRYFIMTGDVVHDAPVEDRSDRVSVLHGRLFGAETAKPEQPAEVADQRVLVIDSSVHSGSTMLSAVRKAYAEGAALVDSYTLVLKRSSTFIPTLWGMMMDDHDRAYFMLDVLPNNRLRKEQTGADLGVYLRRLEAEDVLTLPVIECGVDSMDDTTWGSRWFELQGGHHDKAVYVMHLGPEPVGYLLPSCRHKSVYVREPDGGGLACSDRSRISNCSTP